MTTEIKLCIGDDDLSLLGFFFSFLFSTRSTLLGLFLVYCGPVTVTVILTEVPWLPTVMMALLFTAMQS